MTNPVGPLVYRLAGDDAAIFQVDVATGEVSYQSWFTPSYAEVWDLDRDHIYSISVIGTDAAGIEASRSELELVVSETDAVWQIAAPPEPAGQIGSIVYSLVGQDSAIFQVDAATGDVSYQSWFTPSYAEVWDLDRDHIYEISVIGTDAAGMEISRSDLELVVSETDAVWQVAPTAPVEPIDPVDPVDSTIYSLAGEDAAIFQVDTSTGDVSYQSWFTPSYAEVWDWDRDHIYEISVIGTDAAGTEISRSDLELVVSETNAIWQSADGSGVVTPVDPIVPVDPVVDIIRLASDASETIYGIRGDTSSRGIDLAGAEITATYADGTVEHLTWQALDPYTNGGATGNSITMFYGWSQHELTVTKALASLEIDLKPAGSVFDTTVTLDSDPLGGSTPGSSFGYTFEFLGQYADLGGDVTVTYSSIVNLVGRAADGDLYTTMRVDFSDLSGGGISGNVAWNTDIDTLRYAGDFAPAGSNAALAGDGAVTGTTAADFLNGAAGADTIIGLAGNDTLSGGADADTFVFTPGAGDDVIADFDIAGGDVLNIEAFGFADFVSVLAATSDVGLDAMLYLDSTTSVTLAGVSTSDLSLNEGWVLL